MRGSARQKTVAGGARVRDARKLCVCGSALFPLKSSARTGHDQSNGITFAGDLRQRLRADGGTLRERQER